MFRWLDLTAARCPHLPILCQFLPSTSSLTEVLSDADSIRAVDHPRARRRTRSRTFASHQQASVASGQGVAFWMPKVTWRTDAFNAALSALRRSTTEAAAPSSLDEATAAMQRVRGNRDKRAHDYIRAGQSLMASDMISPKPANSRRSPRSWRASLRRLRAPAKAAQA